jgi:hypothetical protein
MQTKRNSHIRTLFQVMKPGHVVTSEYLLSLGIPKGQQAYYAKSGWLEPVGSGAFKKPGDTISWEGAIQALQQQTEIPVHLGAQTAAEFHGNVHYLRMWAKFRVDLLTPRNTKLPQWLFECDSDFEIRHFCVEFLPEKLQVEEEVRGRFTIRRSGEERAMMECLYLAPEHIALEECYHLMEGSAGLDADKVMELMQNTGSEKVKRLFLYLAEIDNPPWLKKLNRRKIRLGKEWISLTDFGTYISKYRLEMPFEFEQPWYL